MSTNGKICIQVKQVSHSCVQLYTHLTPRLQCASLWTKKHIFEVQLDIILNARHPGNRVDRRCNTKCEE